MRLFYTHAGRYFGVAMKLSISTLAEFTTLTVGTGEFSATDSDQVLNLRVHIRSLRSYHVLKLWGRVDCLVAILSRYWALVLYGAV
jgi:hypothetical protein